VRRGSETVTRVIIPAPSTPIWVEPRVGAWPGDGQGIARLLDTGKESVLLLASNEPIRESVLGQAICDDPVSGHKP
jgi:hypothetical protein